MTATAERSAVRTRDVEVGDHSLHLNETGEPGQTAVLWLHGSGPGVGARSNWERLITELLPGFHHVAPDILGFGESSHPDPAPVGIKAFTEARVDSILGLLDELGIDKTHVVGNSMGGMIALRLAQKAPERLNRIALMGSGGAPVPPTEALIQMVMYYEDPGPAAMRALLGRFIHDSSVFGDTLDAIASDRADKASRPGVERSHRATFDMAGEMLSFSEEELAAITHESLVLHGREDVVIPVDASYYIATNLPNAQLHVLPHAGHWMQLEQADRFAQQARLFFNEGVEA